MFEVDTFQKEIKYQLIRIPFGLSHCLGKGTGKMIVISEINKHYKVRALQESDVNDILELCQKNPLFYKYTEAEPTKEQILNDMKATPPGTFPKDKYFFGLFERDVLVAVMDLVDGYPDSTTAYIGFFMMNSEYQGKQEGTAIIHEAMEYLSTIGKNAVRLAIDKGNPQSTHFWKKNGFEVLFEVDVNGWTKLVAEKRLRDSILINEERITAKEYIEFLKRTDLGSQYPKERFTERIEKLVKNVSISLVARNDAGLTVGVLFGLTDFCYWLYVTDLGVDRHYERQGIGTRLMKRAHELAGGEKDIAVYLIANENAVPFYQKLGMKFSDDVMQYNHIDWTEWTVK